MKNTPDKELETVTSTDLYEASFLICSGATVKKVEIVREKNKTIGLFLLMGDLVGLNQTEYRNERAVANLTDFKEAYIYLTMLYRRAKRAYKAPESNQEASL